MQLMDRIENAPLQLQWSLFEPSIVFTVRTNCDPVMDDPPELTVAGSVGYSVGLISGRCLQYQVEDSQPEDERGFVTVVRYSPECPTGKATALFNWMSAAMEVTPGENATFLLLLSTVTTLAVHDLLGTMSKKPTKVAKKTMLPNKAEWGAVNIEIGTLERVEFYRPSSANRFWWIMNSQIWAEEIYGTAPTDCGGGGACGGGASAAGTSDSGGGCLAAGGGPSPPPDISSSCTMI